MKVPEWFWSGIVIVALVGAVGFTAEWTREELTEQRHINQAQADALASLLVEVDHLKEDVKRLDDQGLMTWRRPTRQCP